MNETGGNRPKETNDVPEESGVSVERLTRGDYDRAIWRNIQDSSVRRSRIIARRLADDARGENPDQPVDLIDAFAMHLVVVEHVGRIANLYEEHHDLDMTHTLRMNFLLGHVAHQLAWSTISEQRTDPKSVQSMIQTMMPEADNIADRLDVNVAWVSKRIEDFGLALHNCEVSRAAIELEPVVELDDPEQLRESTTELLDHLKAYRQYGIKSAIHDDATGQSWMLRDFKEMWKSVEAAISADLGEEIQGVRGSFDGLLVASLMKERPDTTVLSIEKGGERSVIFGEAADATFTSVLAEDGEVYLDTYGAVSAREMYEAAGKPDNYEVLRNYLVQALFDLTVPAEESERHHIETARRFPTEEQSSPRRTREGLQRLSLPRIKYLEAQTPEDFEQVITVHEQPAVETEETTSGKRRTPRGHDVTDHTMRLRPGYRADPKKLEEAREAGVYVPPGHTYIGKHSRGDKTRPVPGHEAKRRDTPET